MHKVWFLAFDNFQILDITGPLSIFSTVNDERRAAGEPPIYDIRIMAVQAGEVRSSSVATLAAEALPEVLTQTIDTVVVPGGPGLWTPRASVVGSPDGSDPATFLSDWLERSSAHIGRLVSVCTGAFVLARTGVLDGGSAVTHWAACGDMAARHPAVDVQNNAIYTRYGRCWTSAGVTAGIDLALALVEADRGRDIAMTIAKRLVVFYRRPGGQAQFSSELLEQAAGDKRIVALHRWIAANLQTAITVEVLADRLAMSPRTFARFYFQQTGNTPADGVERIRIEHACRLIETSPRSVKALAAQCGFGSDEVMRRAFLRRLHVSPTAYQQRFSAAQGSDVRPS